jgi:hypothetical protein
MEVAVGDGAGQSAINLQAEARPAFLTNLTW